MFRCYSYTIIMERINLCLLKCVSYTIIRERFYYFSKHELKRCLMMI